MSRRPGLTGTRSTPAQIAARREAILKLARQGVSTKNIARTVNGTTVTEVQRVRREAGLSTAPRPLSEEQIAKARQLMLDGASRKEAARSVGATADQLRRALPELSGWDRATQTEAEHATGLRERNRPMIERRPSTAPTSRIPERMQPTTGPFA